MVKKFRFNINRLHLRKQDQFFIPDEIAHQVVPEGFPQPTDRLLGDAAATSLSDEQALELEDQLVATGNDLSTAASDDISEENKRKTVAFQRKPCQLELMNLLACWRKSGTDNPNCLVEFNALRNCSKTISVIHILKLLVYYSSPYLLFRLTNL